MSINPVRFDDEVFRTHFNRRPFYLDTSLREHPAFDLSRIIALAKRLRPSLVEYSGGNQAVGVRPGETPRTGLGIEETLQRIQERCSWMVLKRVEEDPEYSELLQACLAPIELAARHHVGESFDAHAFIFISSPDAVTPLHIDHEHNVLCQIRGSKTVHMWDPDDRSVVSEKDLETFHSAFVHRNLPYDERFGATERVLPLREGQGLHFPVTAPHWVKNGSEVSVSFSLTFRSEWAAARERLHRMNARLRRLGFEPTPVGHNVFVDAAKLRARDALVRARGLLLWPMKKDGRDQRAA
jgi:hypothetical protein